MNLLGLFIRMRPFWGARAASLLVSAASRNELLCSRRFGRLAVASSDFARLVQMNFSSGIPIAHCAIARKSASLPRIAARKRRPNVDYANFSRKSGLAANRDELAR